MRGYMTDSQFPQVDALLNLPVRGVDGGGPLRPLREVLNVEKESFWAEDSDVVLVWDTFANQHRIVWEHLAISGLVDDWSNRAAALTVDGGAAFEPWVLVDTDDYWDNPNDETREWAHELIDIMSTLSVHYESGTGWLIRESTLKPSTLVPVTAEPFESCTGANSERQQLGLAAEIKLRELLLVKGTPLGRYLATAQTRIGPSYNLGDAIGTYKADHHRTRALTVGEFELLFKQEPGTLEQGLMPAPDHQDLVTETRYWEQSTIRQYAKARGVELPGVDLVTAINRRWHRRSH